MRCPQCGATNPDTAAWCGQCYLRFDAAAPVTGNGQDGAAAAGSVAAPAQRRSGDVPAGFRREGDDVLWECPQCATENSIEAEACVVCGTSFLQRFSRDEPEPAHNWTTALVMSVATPGAGHLTIGRPGSGVARLVLFWSWLGGGVLLLTQGSGAVSVATPLLLGAAAVWVGTIVDVLRLQHGESELLVGRTLLWLVVGVLVLLGIGLFAATGASAPVAT